jgi:hypothetical protein
MHSKQWLRGNDRERANLKQQQTQEKSKMVMQESGALLWLNNESDLTRISPTVGWTEKKRPRGALLRLNQILPAERGFVPHSHR